MNNFDYIIKFQVDINKNGVNPVSTSDSNTISRNDDIYCIGKI
jgi:hypothetical protein